MAKMMNWVSGMGGALVSTLPLLAAFLLDPVEPSPYSPVSRLFWNEFYIDPTRAPEFRRCAAARQLVSTAEFQASLAELRNSPQVNYPEAMALKRRVLEELAACAATSRHGRLEAFRAAQPRVADYAAFRAVGEKVRTPWPQWPERLRDGDIRAEDYDTAARDYHLYVQWLAHEQLHSLAEKAERRNIGLNLDLPLGVHSHGYDVWRERDSFVLGMHGGAPPDLYFTKGQDWGFAPLHPEAMRANGYRYFIAAIRHHLQFAHLLRIDHVLGLHRLYWVPRDMSAADGVYVRYRAEELYAILCQESHRRRARIVGENLGTVPARVNESMERHRIYGMYVAQLEIKPEQQPVLSGIPRLTLASLNTHDLPTFAGYWRGLDIDDRLRIGLLDQAAAEAERAKLQSTREAVVQFLYRRGLLEENRRDDEAVLAALLAFLAAGGEEMMLVSLEDLWDESAPQNIPGSGEQHPNWRRKARLTFEEFAALRRVKTLLRIINRLRRRNAAAPR
jgi:4-alpha-glucanotransferase